MPRPTECRYCGEKTIVEDNRHNLVFKCGTAMWDNGANLAGHQCRTNCLYQAAELRERINVISKERDEAIEREKCLINELTAVKDNLSEHLKLRLELQKQRCGVIRLKKLPMRMVANLMKLRQEQSAATLDDLRLKGD